MITIIANSVRCLRLSGRQPVPDPFKFSAMSVFLVETPYTILVQSAISVHTRNTLKQRCHYLRDSLREACCPSYLHNADLSYLTYI